MSDVLSDNEQVKAFAEVVLKNLSGNGFPMKKVSLPLEKLYEAAENKGISFNKVLEYLKENHQIQHDSQGDKIIFSLNVDPDMLSQAQEMLSKMSDSERQELMEKAKQMFGSNDSKD